MRMVRRSKRQAILVPLYARFRLPFGDASQGRRFTSPNDSVSWVFFDTRGTTLSFRKQNQFIFLKFHVEYEEIGRIRSIQDP